MELKLQQAIVATRAGQIEVAQSLLMQLIREEPEDANAWFLLSYLVDSPDRQILYLQKTLELDPENEIARHYQAQLQNALVPAPVIWQGEQDNAASADVDEQESEIAAAAAALDVAAGSEQAQQDNKNELPEWLQNLDQKQLRSDSPNSNGWSNVAGPPQRENSNSTQETREQQSPLAKASNGKSTGEAWLVRILVIMVILAAIVLGFLVFLILIQP
jgi:hypothetical protein